MQFRSRVHIASNDKPWTDHLELYIPKHFFCKEIHILMVMRKNYLFVAFNMRCSIPKSIYSDPLWCIKTPLEGAAGPLTDAIGLPYG